MEASAAPPESPVAGPTANWFDALVPVGTALAFIGSESPNPLFRVADGSPLEATDFPRLAQMGIARLPTRQELGGDSVAGSVNFLVRVG